MTIKWGFFLKWATFVVVCEVIRCTAIPISDEKETDCGCGEISRDNIRVTQHDFSIGNEETITEDDGLKGTVQLSSYPVEKTTLEDMVFIPGGDTFIGTDKPQVRGDGESPLRTVSLSPYFIDRYSVTNEGEIPQQ